MRLKSIIAAVIVSVTIMPVFFMFIPLRMVYSVSEKTELQNYAGTADILTGIIEQKGAYYHSFTADWGSRDETYRFIMQGNDAFMKDGLNDFIFDQIGTQFMIFLGRDYTEYYSAYADECAPYVEELVRVIRKNKSYIEKLAFSKRKFMILGMPSAGTPVLLSVSPVKPANPDKPAGGFIFMGHVIDQKFLTEIYSGYGFERGSSRVSLSASSAYVKESVNSIISVELLSRDTAKISLTLKELSGKSVLSLFFPIKRESNMAITHTLHLSYLIFSSFSLLVFILSAFVFRKIIIEPAETLAVHSAKSAEGKPLLKEINQRFYPVEMRLISASMKKIAEKNDKMEKNLLEISNTDKLTRIANRRFFDEIFLYEWNFAKRIKRPLGLLIVDLDDFKLYNDDYGYSAGDKCIAHMADIIKSSLKRNTDIIVRYGGEEFIILLPDTDLAGAAKIADDILTEVRSAAVPHSISFKEKIMTVSIGLCSMIPENTDTKEKLLLEADKALYEAKKNKNCAFSFNTL